MTVLTVSILYGEPKPKILTVTKLPVAMHEHFGGNNWPSGRCTLLVIRAKLKPKHSYSFCL